MFWNRVKSCIKEKGVTQQEAAKALRFSFSTFRNWMTKNVNPPLMYAATMQMGIQNKIFALQFTKSGIC
jgi:transcriptional regulator with XRE-family HTH domain